MSDRKGILCAGNWIVDRVKMIDTYPHEEALANILSESIGNGGGAFNVAIDLSRLGADFPIYASGCIGDDTEATWIENLCAEHHIETTGLHRIPQARTSYTDVMSVQKTGRRTFFHHRGSNAMFGPERIVFANAPKILHLAYLLLLDRFDEPSATHGTAAANLLAEATRQGILTSIDVVSEDSERFQSVVIPALPHTDVCFMNDFEAARTTGIAIEHPKDVANLRKAAQSLHSKGVRQAVILHTSTGGFGLLSDGSEFWQPAVALPQSEIVGSVGAGDAFAAGFLLGLHAGKPLNDCLRYAVCTAAASLKHASASMGVETLENCLDLGEKYGYHAF